MLTKIRLIIAGISLLFALGGGLYLYLKGGWDKEDKLKTESLEEAVTKYETERDVKERINRTPFDGVLDLNDWMWSKNDK